MPTVYILCTDLLFGSTDSKTGGCLSRKARAILSEHMQVSAGNVFGFQWSIELLRASESPGIFAPRLYSFWGVLRGIFRGVQKYFWKIKKRDLKRFREWNHACKKRTPDKNPTCGEEDNIFTQTSWYIYIYISARPDSSRLLTAFFPAIYFLYLV